MQQRDKVASACSTQVHWAHKICRSRWKGHVAKQWFNGSHPWKATAPRGTDRSSHSTKLRASKPATMQWLLFVVPAKYWPKRHETQDAVAAMHDPPLLVDDAGVYTLCIYVVLYSILWGYWELTWEYENPSWEFLWTNQQKWYDMVWLCGFWTLLI